MLPEERFIVESVEGDPVRSLTVSLSDESYANCRFPYSFSRSSCDFFGMISSMCGASNGYVSTILVRMAR